MPAYHNRQDTYPGGRADPAMSRPELNQQELDIQQQKREKRAANLKKLAATYEKYGAKYDEKNRWVTIPFGKKRRVVEDERTLRKVLKLPKK